MGELDTRTIGDYAAMVAAGTPTPGGGSVAATCGGLGAALGEMVCNLTAPKLAHTPERAALEGAATALSAIRDRLFSMAVDDEQVYGHYREASALPKGTDLERQARTAAQQAALVAAAESPLGAAGACVDALAHLLVAAQHGSRHALSDVISGANLLEAAARSTLENVAANAAMIHDERVAADLRSRAAALSAAAVVGRDAAIETARGR